VSITLKNDGNLEVRNPAPVVRTESKQRRRMLAAIAVLMAAVIVVLIKDRELWFHTSADSDSDQTMAVTAPGPEPVVPAAQNSAPAAVPANSGSTPGKRPVQRAASRTETMPGAPMISATDRAVLPPLEVEVVAGNQHRPLVAANNSVDVQMQDSPASAGPASASTHAPEVQADSHVSLSPAASERVTRTVQPNYPLLAKQMKVQGAVVLQALIDKTGGIEDLHVISGPAILAEAARQAVKQWHFKPYFQSGEAVETEARITVNFTISTY